MITITPALAAHYAGGSTTLATCLRVTLTNGTVYGFTSVDIDLDIDGVTYLAASGITPSAIVSTNTLAVDNMEVKAFLDNDAITEGDLNAGLWDYAEVHIFEVNYLDLAAGIRRESRGHIGEVSSWRNAFTAELRGLTDAYTRMLGELYGPACRANFGDSRCGISLAAHTVTGTIGGVSADGRIITDNARTESVAVPSKTITDISQAQAAVVTAPGHGFKSGQLILITGVAGVSQQGLNGINGRNYVISVTDADHFAIAVDTRPLTDSAENGPTTEAQVYSPYGGGGMATPAGVLNYFTYGVMTITSGQNTGLAMDVGAYVPGQMTLRLSFPYPLAVGDTYTLSRGCGKRFIEDCVGTYHNGDAFRGEPFLPGMDQIMRFGGQSFESSGSSGGSSGGGGGTDPGTDPGGATGG